MDRGRDRRFEDNDRGGETYRPSDRNGPPPRSDFRGYRSPPRRGRTPPPYADSYAPSADRRRSRSPAYKGREQGSYRGRPRSPQRGYSPRRDTRARTPPPRARRFSRSPVGRPRSPLPVKRDPSPYRRPRSPIAAKRIASPVRDRFERHGDSPPRNSRPRYPEENNYRPGARSPSQRRSEHVSRMASPISSRRSSSHVHPDRMMNTGSRAHSPDYRGSRVPLPARDSSYRERSPPRRAQSPPRASPPRGPVAYRTRSPPPPRDEHRNGATPAAWSDAQIAPSQPSTYRNGDSRPPPSGPSYRGSYARESPAEQPSVATPISMSAHNRPTRSSVVSTSTRPRGGTGFGGRGEFAGRGDFGGRGESRDRPYGGPSSYRGGRPPPASPYNGAPRQTYDTRPSLSDHVPSRPRNHGPTAAYENPAYRAPPPFRSNNSSSTTYPRTQRFSTNHLASVPAIKEGGEALPSLVDPATKKRLAELEESKKKLMDQIEEKQREKRKQLREWDSMERESRRESLRSELAETALEAMSGDGTGTIGTAF